MNPSTGHTGAGAYFLYYDPHENRCIWAQVSLYKSSTFRPEVPEGHPVGFYYDSREVGWDTGLDQGNDGDEDLKDQGFWENYNPFSGEVDMTVPVPVLYHPSLAFSVPNQASAPAYGTPPVQTSF